MGLAQGCQMSPGLLSPAGGRGNVTGLCDQAASAEENATQP